MGYEHDGERQQQLMLALQTVLWKTFLFRKEGYHSPCFHNLNIGFE